MNFLKLIRYPNLIMLALTLVLVRNEIFGFESLIFPKLDDLHFSLYIISTLLLAASGYIINDLMDLKADLINKPHKVFVGNTICKKNAQTMYWVFNITGILIGLYVCYELNSVFNAFVCILTSIFLFLYSFKLQKIALVGNLVISLLIPSSLLALYVFEYDLSNFQNGLYSFYILLPYLIFAFLTNLMREVIKDIEDINGDYNMNFKTLPIIIGKTRARNFVLIITTLVLLLAIFMARLVYVNDYSFFLLFGIIALVILPILIFFYQLWSAKTKKEFHQSSKFLKIIMVLGILTMLFIHY